MVETFSKEIRINTYSDQEEMTLVVEASEQFHISLCSLDSNLLQDPLFVCNILVVAESLVYDLQGDFEAGRLMLDQIYGSKATFAYHTDVDEIIEIKRVGRTRSNRGL